MAIKATLDALPPAFATALDHAEFKDERIVVKSVVVDAYGTSAVTLPPSAVNLAAVALARPLPYAVLV